MSKGSGGGGYGSKQHVEGSVRTGSGSRNARPAGATNIGLMYGDHTTNRPGSSGYRGEQLHGPAERNFNPTKYGNEIAASTKPGPGGSRQVMSSGSQGTHGPVTGTRAPQGRGFDERG